MEISFEILNTLSRSKGWWRYRAAAGERDVIQSRTGNQWVSAPHTGEIEPGTEFLVVVELCLNVGKGRTRREERHVQRLRMVAEPGAVAGIGTSASYFRANVHGARLVSSDNE